MLENLADLHFLRPWAFLGFIVLALVLLFWRNKTTSVSSWKHYCDEKFLSHLGVGENEVTTKRWHLWLAGIAVSLGLLALAGPVWEKLPQPVFKTEQARVYVLDLSRSMMATDISPNRLARAKHKLLDMLAMSREGQSALIVFAQEPYVVSPLTDDANTIAATIPSLDTDLVPVQGSDVAAALDKAIGLLTQSNFSKGDIFLIGDDAGEDPVEIAQKVKDAGFQLNVLAIGTEQGSPVKTHGGDLLKDNRGAIVIPKLDTAAMNQMARVAGGKYSQISVDDNDVNYLLSGSILGDVHIEDEKSQRQTDQWVEEGPWIILLLLPLVALGFRKGWLAGFVLLFVGLPPDQAYAMDLKDVWKSQDQQAYELMLQDKPKEAAPLFEDKEWQGVAHYRSGEFDKAAEALSQSESTDAQYNRANSLAQLGKLEDAIAAYDEALKDNPQHEDAKFNRDLLKDFLERQKDQQQDQQQNGEDGQEQQDQQDKEGNKKKDGQKGENKDSDSQNGEEKNQQQDAESQKGENQGQQDAGKGEEDSQQGEKSAAEKQKQAEEEEQQKMASSEKDPASDDKDKDENKAEGVQGQLAQQEYKEDKQAMEQWLRRIPDDPGGLLRQKFLMQHRL
ncbi:MAG: VWA domain-containing protein, partial [Gammaproteobacteria bacterium]|nr:VWA domain-containing protein [Gammaproteobacteria bacterium]